MHNTPNTEVRMFGSLHTIRRKRGLDPRVEMYVLPEGISGYALAHELDLPADKIDRVFINNTACSLDELIRPGDKVAFLSPWRPI
ncbi:hypothetical protein A7E78_00055 [Syntrophotalea acetylenivorans]|uniref:MoaD/ThiS family protein n=2 Tax=Syntrophotalea acetylenivorans TaxID=1842532 RepID=A0A1L3GSP7_9BACT|nr:hypothetical protein A7E78_00055 [Syntrophotalea acetylenivorans]